METNENKRQRLEQLLALLDDKSLRSSYKSVDNFFTKMKQLNEKVLNNVSAPGDIEDLLIDKISGSRIPDKIETLLIDKIKIEKLLALLDDGALQRAHKSVLISFNQMLAYIDNIIDSDTKRSNTPEGEARRNIAFLLRTYQGMAQKFYSQFEQSLLAKIEYHHNLQIEAGVVIEQIDQNLNIVENNDIRNAMITAKGLLVQSRESAEVEQKKLVGEYPTLMQKALDKLIDEWQRLDTIATAGKTIAEDKKLIRALITVAKAAAYFVEVEAEQVVVVSGNSFALYFFSYLVNFAVLTVPIYSVRSPWEWSIFWHELAGYKVRKLENTAVIEDIRKRLVDFHNQYKQMNKGYKSAWLGEVTRHNQHSSASKVRRKNQFSHDYLSDVFSKKSPKLIDLGGFEHQFERMLARLPRKNRFQNYEEIKNQGWNVDWFKELFEDAWSVIAIREPFLDFFEDILNRHISNDGRHPPVEVRISVAKELLKLMDPNCKLTNKPSLIEKAAAEQILSFVSLLIAASPNFDSKVDTESRIMSNFVRYSLPDVVGRGIGESIKDWSTKYLTSRNRATSSQKGARDFLQTFSDQQLSDFTNYVTHADQGEENKVQPSYEGLFKNKNYKELLDLSFYEVDFGYPTGLTATFTNIDNNNARKTWQVSAINVVALSGFTIISAPSPVTGNLPDRQFNLTDIHKVTTWYSISETDFRNYVRDGKITPA